MKTLEAILAAALLAGLSGCAARAKAVPPAAVPAAPTPPPPALSVPQTQVDLPRPQPFNPDALVTATPTPPPPAAPPPPESPKPAQPSRSVRNTAPPKPETPPPAEATRQPIKEILPASEQQRLRRNALDHRRRAEQLVGQAQRRSLTAAEQALIVRINEFLKSSGDAESSGDLRSADELASRALSLAGELQNGK